MMNNLNSVKELLSQRHSHYQLASELVAPQAEVEQMLKEVLALVPSHFNSQGVRMVLLTGEAHKQHWQLIEKVLIQNIGEEAYNSGTRDKIHTAFMSGVGTVLFFDEEETTQQLMKQFPLYAHNFPKWAEQVQGSHQLAVWLGLVGLGFGASLQHYIGMDDDAIRNHVGAPQNWRLVAQMPFGKALDEPGTKEKLPVEQLLKVLD